MIDEAAAAIAAGRPVVIPTDTVYGLVSSAASEAPTRAIQALKGRSTGQPLALMASSVEALIAALPELRGTPLERVVEALLPGPYTFVLPNPAARFPWLNGDRQHTIGVRVPDLPAAAAALLARTGAVVSTSANLHGGPTPAALADIPAELLAGCGAVLDGGRLPGTASTVIDLSGHAPVVLREGAVSAAEALARVAAALAG